MVRGASGGSKRASGGYWVVRGLNNESAIEAYKAVGGVGVGYISMTSFLPVTWGSGNRRSLECSVWTTTISNSFLAQHRGSLRQIRILERKARIQQFAHVHKNTSENERR